MPSSITLNDLIPTIKEVVNSGNEATFVPNGESMKPFLHGGKDTIILKKPEFPLNKYDIPLYVRQNGTVVLHRIVKVKDTEKGRLYFLRGDNTWALEEGISAENIVAVVSKFRRKGKWYSVQDKNYRFYSVFWCKIFPIRKFIFFFITLPPRAVRKMARIIKHK